MALESKKGISCKVTVGATNSVLGMGTLTIGGASVEELDVTEFGDLYQDIELGLITGGTFSFSGLYRKDDTQGQDLVRQAFWYKSDLSNVRFWIDSVSYYTANTTTAAGGGLPAAVPVGKIYVTSEPETSVDKAGLATISFSGRVVPALRLV